MDWQFTGGISLLPESGSLSETADIWNGIVGIRGKLTFGDRWFVPYYLDVGSGSSDLTWQGQAGIGYAFHWGNVLLVYRDQIFDSGAGIIERLRLTGPAVGVGIRF